MLPAVLTTFMCIISKVGRVPPHAWYATFRLRLPSPFEQSLLKFQGPGPEAINGRLAMVSFLGIAGVELATGQPILAQAATPAGAAAAAGLALAVSAASLVPLLLGRVKPQAAFPSPNDSFPDRQLPYFWTALAEVRAARAPPCVFWGGTRGLTCGQQWRTWLPPTSPAFRCSSGAHIPGLPAGCLSARLLPTPLLTVSHALCLGTIDDADHQRAGGHGGAGGSAGGGAGAWRARSVS